jgi:hypothetical protein
LTVAVAASHIQDCPHGTILFSYMFILSLLLYEVSPNCLYLCFFSIHSWIHLFLLDVENMTGFPPSVPN